MQGLGAQIGNTAMESWGFAIEFDEKKAKANGYDVDGLYECASEYAERMGNVRMARSRGRQRIAKFSSAPCARPAPLRQKSLG